MKNATIGFLIACLLLLTVGWQRTDSGDTIIPVSSAKRVTQWENIGTITASNATLAVGARDYSAVYTDLPDANTIKVNVPNKGIYAEFAFATTTDADAHVVEMWVAANSVTDSAEEDIFLLGGTHTLTGGTQVGFGESNVMVDTWSEAENYLNDGVVLDGGGNNRVSIYRVDIRDIDRITMIATTLEAGKTITGYVRYWE